jgi:hypothetical protein
MAQRDINIQDLKNAISGGFLIKEYPDDIPYPSKLLLGFSGPRPIHVVYSELESHIIIISAYEPDRGIWDPSYTRRKL